MASTAPLPQGFAQQWQTFRRGPPGRRFLGSYERHQRAAKKGRWAGKLLCIGGGAVLIALGLVFVVIPGPAILFFLLGGGLLARESPGVARALDWIEVRVRAVATWAQKHWKRAKLWQRVLVVLLAAIAGLAAAGAVVWLLFRR